MTTYLLLTLVAFVWFGWLCESERRRVLRLEARIARARHGLHERATAPGFAPDAADHHSEASA